MKDLVFRLLVLILFLAFGECNISAQVVARWKIPTLIPSNSTIREWRSVYSIGYGFSEEYPSSKCFFLYDPVSPTVNMIEFSDDYMVTDFRVMNDSVFFCGVDIRSSEGIVGCFDIVNTMITGTDSILFCKLRIPLSSLRVTISKRMDVYYDEGATHIAFVGDMVNSASTVTTTVGHAYYDGVNWNYNIYDNTSGDMVFTDIAASSQYLAAVAKKNMDPNCYVHMFKVSNDFLNTPLNAGSCFVLNGRDPLGDILVEDLSETEFALSYHFRIGLYSITDVQLFKADNVSSTLILQNTIQTIHGPMELYTPAWKMKELCFDPSTQHLLLLHDAATQVVQTVESSVFKYDIPNINSGWAGVSYSPHVVIDKIDAATNNGYWSIGEENYGLGFSRETLATAATCRQDYNLSYIFSAGAVNIAPFLLMPFSNTDFGEIIKVTIHYPYLSVNCTEF